MARARAATFLLLTAGAFAVLACAQDAESGVSEAVQRQLEAATARSGELAKTISALELAAEEDKFQRASLKADRRAREDELEAAKLRAGELEREVADLKAAAASAAEHQQALASSLAQLKGSLSAKVQELEADLEARGKHTEAVSRQVLDLRSEVVSAQRAAEDARRDASAADERVKAAGSERDAALTRAKKAEKEASRAKADLMHSKMALRDSEMEQKAATQEVATLEAALSKARSAAADAEARADEASKLTDQLLAEHYNEWVPHWVAYGYEKRVKPATAAAMETASELSASAAATARHLARQGSAHGRVLHRSASQKAGEAWRSAGEGASRLWKGAGPTAHGYILAAQKAIDKETQRVRQGSMPYLMAACDASRKAWDATQAHTAAVFQSDALAKLSAQFGRLVSEVEGVFARLLEKVKPLAFLASPRYITYVTGAVLAAPLLTILLPLLLLRQGKRKRPAPEASAGTPHGADTVDSNGGGRRTSAKKGRRITMGPDSVAFA